MNLQATVTGDSEELPESPGSVQVSTILQRLGSGVSWSLSGAVVTAVTNLGLSVALVRLLGRTSFGEFSIIQNTVVTVGGAAQLAMGYTANRYVAELHASDRVKAGRVIAFCSMVSVATAIFACVMMLAGSDWLAVKALHKPRLAGGLSLGSIAVLFTVLNGFQVGSLAGLESYKKIARATAIATLLNALLCCIASAVYGRNGVVSALGVGAFAQWLIFKRELSVEMKRQNIVPIYRDLSQESAILFRFGLPAAISGFVTMPAQWLANSFLIRTAAGVEQVAIFAVANTLRSLVMFLPLIFNRVTTTLLNQQRGANEQAGYRQVFRINLIATTVLAIAGAAAVAVAGPWLLRSYGKDFYGGYPVLLVMLMATAFEVVFQAMYQLIQSNDKMWLSFSAVVVPRDGLTIVLAYLLVPKWGVLGLAVSYAGAWLLAVALVLVLISAGSLLPAPANA